MWGRGRGLLIGEEGGSSGIMGLGTPAEQHMKSISPSTLDTPPPPRPSLPPVSPQRSEPVLQRDPALLSLLMELLEHMASLRASSPSHRPD